MGVAQVPEDVGVLNEEALGTCFVDLLAGVATVVDQLNWLTRGHIDWREVEANGIFVLVSLDQLDH